VDRRAVARWTPNDSLEIIPFWNKSSVNDWEVRPFPFTAGPYLPPKFNRLTYFGQPYNDWEENDTNFGVLARTVWDNWTFRLGAFRSLAALPETALIFYFNGDPNGVSDVSFLSNRRRDTRHTRARCARPVSSPKARGATPFI